MIVESSTEPDAYVAGYGFRSLRPVVLGFIVPGIFIVIGVLNWGEAWIFAVVGLAITAALLAFILARMRRITRHEVTLVIDSRGVWIGGDRQRLPVLEPWSKIDAVVYFDSWLNSRNPGRKVPHIGVVRGRKIFSFLDVSDWQIDYAQAGVAVARFGHVPFREAPLQDDVPPLCYAGISLPDDWFATPV